MTHYEPLSCNVDISSCDVASATPLSTLVAATNNSTSHVVVPCNTCAYVDYTEGEVINLPNGLDVVGRLIFPSTANVELELKAVFVQGMLDITKPDGGNKVTISLYGDTEEVYFYPHESCSGSYDPSCVHRANVGFKPIVVAGGESEGK